MTSHSPVYKKVQKNAFISYISSEQVWRYDVKPFLSYSKNYICTFMQANSWHHRLFHFHLSFWILKVWKEREITKNEYLKNQKSSFDEIKNIFHNFWRTIIWWKNKNLIKNSRYKLWFDPINTATSFIKNKNQSLKKVSRLFTSSIFLYFSYHHLLALYHFCSNLLNYFTKPSNIFCHRNSIK